MLLLTAHDINKVFSMKDAIESNKKAFLLHTEGQTEVPVRISFNVNPQSTSQFMPAYVKADVNRVGLKIVSTFPANAKKGIPVVCAQVMLLDNITGEVCALMDGTEITKIRTGAISGAATDILARKNAETAALFGTGGQSARQMEALLTVRKIKELRIYDIFPEKVRAFVTQYSDFAEKYGTRLIAASTPEEAIDQADIISTATISKTPVFDGSKVIDGAHVNGVGSYTPNARELDYELISRARLFVDNKEAVCAEAGDVIIPVKEGKCSFDCIVGELGDVLAGNILGRENDKQITVMKTVGFAVLDVVAAWNIYNNAILNGVGTQI